MTVTHSRTPRGRESGQASLEKIGALLLVGVVIVALVLTVNSGSAGRVVAQAWCLITGGGAGDCAPLGVDPKVPTEPCVVDESGHQASLKGAVVLSLEGNRALLVEELSDGTYKVSMIDGGAVGAEGGFGWDARVEVNGTRWGSDLYAGGGVFLDGSVSQVWNVTSNSELQSLVTWARFSDVNDAVAGPLGPVTSWIGEQTGFVERPRTPDSVIYTGGVSAEGSAGITAWIGGGELAAGLNGNVGVETHADGGTTYYVGGGGQLELSGAISIVHDSLGGEASTRMIVDTDADGTITKVTFETNVESGDERKVYTDTLPLRTDADRDLFQDYLAEAVGATGIGLDFPATEEFARLMDQRGQQTRLTYDTSDGLDVKAVASGKWIGEIGLEGAFAMPHSQLTGAEYDNGQSWVPWSGCLA